MKKIAVAMSGGVDSSVAAALLKAQGNKVIGLYFDLGNSDSKEKMKKAKMIAEKLEIEFKSVDVAKIFKKEIIDDFVHSYEKGLTPNPCVVCNKKIKFDFLLREAEHLGCDLAATGHYVRVSPSVIPAKAGISKKLLTAKDETKDQSYFLYTLTQTQLSKLIFPLGEYTKVEVKKMARQMGFESDKESQDICFLAGTTCSEFLQKNIKAKAGKIRVLNSPFGKGGKGDFMVGEHKGLHLYTIGQRRGIEIGGTGPYYVVRKDYGTNELIVSNDAKDISLLKDSLTASDVNWISGKAPKMPFKCKARIRYQSDLVSCVVQETSPNPSLVMRGNPPLTKGRLGGVFYVQFTKPQKAITPGQSVVFYKGKEVLGGGVIL